MAQFLNSASFNFNGIDSERFHMYIVTTDSLTENREIGLKSSLNMNDEYLRPTFNSKSSSRKTFTIQMAKLDFYKNPLPMIETDFDNLIRWLEHEEPLPLEVNGLVYYGCFIDYSTWNAKKGIITLTFEMSERWAYSRITRDTFNISNTKVVKLPNKTNINKNVPLNINFKVKNIPGGAINKTFTLTNCETNKTFSVSGLEENDEICLCGDTHEIYCVNNENKNVFNNKKGEFIELVYGLNRLKVTGTVIITFEYQVPIAHR